jgi:hypothetical protein
MNAREVIMMIVEDHAGEESAITARDLLLELWAKYPPAREQVTSVRILLDVIHDMRRAGQVIASSTHGYFKPVDVKEAYYYLDHVLSSRALDLFITRRAQKRAIINEYGRQIPMELK